MIRTFVVMLALTLAGCGYRVGSRSSDVLPPAIQSIAIPAFDNLTTRYKLSERLPSSIGREFIRRTRYRVVSNPDEADAVLRGGVVNIMTFPSVTEPTTARAVGTQIIVVMSVSLTDRKTGKVLYTRPSMDVRQIYEISMDQTKYFEESDVALERLSRDVARTLVSSVLEAF